MLQRGTIIMRSSLVRVHCAFPHVLGSTEGTDVEEIGTHAGMVAVLEKISHANHFSSFRKICVGGEQDGRLRVSFARGLGFA